MRVPAFQISLVSLDTLKILAVGYSEVLVTSYRTHEALSQKTTVFVRHRFEKLESGLV